jgi:hypothetical protein
MQSLKPLPKLHIKRFWVAGPTIENTTEIAGISQIVNKLCL